MVSREELETERGWEESKEVLFPSLGKVGMMTNHNNSDRDLLTTRTTSKMIGGLRQKP